jgi:hypothetical protein
MKKLVVFAIVAVAAWYAWHHWPELVHRLPQHEAEVRNGGGSAILRVRLKVAGQSFVKERLDPGEKVVWRFQTIEDSNFQLDWNWSDRMGDAHWAGGGVTRGPIVEHHVLTIDGDGGVVYTAQPLGTS